MYDSFSTPHRGRPPVLVGLTIVALLIASLPISIPTYASIRHEQQISNLSYKQQHGYWETLDLPKEFSLNTVHASMLPTGKVLLVAGSGNTLTTFNDYHDKGTIAVLKTALLDPTTMKLKLISTPSDLFCSGHAMLQSGELLIAGGTSGYEKLADAVTRPAGRMVIHNENPNDSTRQIKKRTKFTAPDGKVYLSAQDVTLDPAMKMTDDKGAVSVMHSSATVFVEAEQADAAYMTARNLQYAVGGISKADSQNIYAQGEAMSLDKQDFRGDSASYEFDATSESYIKTGNLNVARWYPSLPVLTNGKVLAVSGLDNTGKLTNTSELFDPATKKWTIGTSMDFATYPSLFRTQDSDVLFYSGSNSGYGAADKGRTPGFWNYKTTAFKPVAGLRDPEVTETSASVVLPPTHGSNDGSQSSRIMIAGGGGVGESSLATARTDIIDLASASPKFAPGPDLSSPLRYVHVTVTPWDELFISGGTHDYRGKGNSYSYASSMLNLTTNISSPMADAAIGRGYHSGSILLPDGRIMVFGNDPLYGDKDNLVKGKFEQRIEIFTPPQLFRGQAPRLNATGGQKVHRGQTLTYQTLDASSIQTARLIPPSSTTHVTNIEQRSVGAIVTRQAGSVSITLSNDINTMPDGWYMLFVTTAAGTPSTAVMVQVVS